MHHTEYSANVEGFTCATMQARKGYAARSNGLGFNVFKALGYSVVMLALLAVVF